MGSRDWGSGFGVRVWCSGLGLGGFREYSRRQMQKKDRKLNGSWACANTILDGVVYKNPACHDTGIPKLLYQVRRVMKNY